MSEHTDRALEAEGLLSATEVKAKVSKPDSSVTEEKAPNVSTSTPVAETGSNSAC